MDLRIISDLEEKINRAVEMIRGLKKETDKHEKEKEKLKNQLHDCQKDFDEYRKKTDLNHPRAAGSRPAFESRIIKDRLRKLAGKLAALEDSWN